MDYSFGCVYILNAVPWESIHFDISENLQSKFLFRSELKNKIYKKKT